MSPAVCGRCGWRGRGCTAARCAELTEAPGATWPNMLAGAPSEPWAGVVRGPREVGGAVVLASSPYPCGHRRRDGAEDCPTCERLQLEADAAEDARNVAAQQADAAAPASGWVSPAQRVSDEARAELQALAELLNGPAVPLVDAVPFALQAEPVRESKREAAARQPSIF